MIRNFHSRAQNPDDGRQPQAGRVVPPPPPTPMTRAAKVAQAGEWNARLERDLEAGIITTAEAAEVRTWIKSLVR